MTGPSEFRHRLTIEQPSDVADGAGGQVRSWATLTVVWAEIKPVGVSEAVQSEKRQPNVRYHVVMRYRSNVTTAMRLIYDGRVFRILAVTDSTGRKELTLVTAIEEF